MFGQTFETGHSFGQVIGGGALPPYDGPPMRLSTDAREGGQGKAVFTSRFKNFCTFPLGVPRNQPIGDPARGIQTHFISMPEVHFENFQFSTADPRIARAMVESNRFDDHDGYTIDQECVPAELREFFPRLPRETKRRVILALMDNRTEDQAFDLIDQKDLDKALRPEDELGNSDPFFEVGCPECGLVFKGKGIEAPKQARAALAQHVNIVHGASSPQE